MALPVHPADPALAEPALAKPARDEPLLIPAAGSAANVRRCATAAGIAVAVAVLMAAPWLKQDLVWSGWVAMAAALMLVPHLRGWWGETWSLAAATLAIAIAFHWSPKVLAYAMNVNYEIGLVIAAPIMLYDAARLVVPLWFAARVQPDPLRAWLPAGLLAAALEGVLPAVFPWKFGYSQAAWTPLIQSVDLFGPEFATLVFYAHAGAIVWLVDVARRAAAGLPPLAGRAGLAAVGLVLANLAYGIGAIASWQPRVAAAPTVSVALVQSNPEDADGVDSLRSLTEARCRGTAGLPDLVCWPECSGGSYEASLESLADPNEVLSKSRPPNPGMRPLESPACPLLFGGKIFSGHPDKPRELYQSAILIDPSHAILGSYHKRHLMPFGEYVPGEDWFPDIKRYFPMQDDLTEGRDAVVLGCGTAARLGVMLCYEDMIPKAARTLAASNANVLVSLINGSAFTEPLTLVQHRLLAQLRAVETRRSLLRCAATGQTCSISPLGVVTESLPLQGRGILETRVPLLESRTLYSRIGPAFPLVAWLAVALLVVRGRRGYLGAASAARR
jgi:apolipoprotein N-acyltransferase